MTAARSPAARHVPHVIAVIAAVLLLVGDIAVYRPTQARMLRAERSANQMGFALDPSRQRVILPIQVASFVLDNSMGEPEAATAGRTGMLAADLLDRITRLAAQNGLVVTATEPGITLQQPTEVLVRARVKARGTYGSFLRFVTAIGNGEQLISLDRFSITAGEGATCTIELWVTRHVLKRIPTRRAP